MEDGKEQITGQQAKSKGREYFEALLIAVVFLVFANTFVLQTFYIPSGSMEDTLLIGDHLFVNRFIYGPEGPLEGFPLLPARAVNRGDIVVFRSKQNPPEDVVKRCIGVPGDTVELDKRQLLLNGKAVDESAYVHFIRIPPPRGARPIDILRANDERDNFGPLTVPEDSYFCLGDNRNNSLDSRFWGTLPAHLVKGRASLIYWSYGGETPDGTFRGMGDSASRLARTLLGFFPNTRWERTGHLVR